MTLHLHTPGTGKEKARRSISTAKGSPEVIDSAKNRSPNPPLWANTCETAASRPARPSAKPATDLSVLREVSNRWERDETEPPVGFWNRIIDFLGSYPMPRNGGVTADLVLMVRRVQELSQSALGSKLGVTAKTVR
jgi:hypothetical protein